MRETCNWAKAQVWVVRGKTRQKHMHRQLLDHAPIKQLANIAAKNIAFFVQDINIPWNVFLMYNLIKWNQQQGLDAYRQ